MTVNTGYPDSDPLFRHTPDRLAMECICKEYRLGKFVHNHGDLGGAYNVNLKIETTKGLYVIRIAFGLASAEHIEYSLRVLSVLKASNIPVLLPMINEKGHYYSKYKDRFLQVTPFIDGRQFDSTNVQAYTSGKMLRKIHDALDHIEVGPILAWSNYPSTEILLEGLTLLKEIRNIPEDQLSRVERLYDQVIRAWNVYDGLLPSTIIHGDWHL